MIDVLETAIGDKTLYAKWTANESEITENTLAATLESEGKEENQGLNISYWSWSCL